MTRRQPVVSHIQGKMSFSIKKVLPRLLVFFIGLPLAFSVVYFFPQRNHLLADLVITGLCGLAAFELASIFATKNIVVNKVFAVFLGILIPAGATVSYAFINLDITLAVVFSGVSIIVLKTLFHPVEKRETLLPCFAAETAILLYPGLLFSAVIFLGARADATRAIIFYLAIVLANDSFAWFFGMLFGKGNRGFVKVSPNKSIAGFAGGILSSLALGVVFQRYIPFTMPGAGLLIAFFTAAAATIGDLGESALKRSAGVKDSGRLFPGRGGVLDSLDSLTLAAPVFYFLFSLFTGE
jgi:phosphatidate cytidylyltransferase